MRTRQFLFGRWLAPVALGLLATGLAGTALAQEEAQQETPTNTDGVVDVITMYRTLNPTTFDYHNWTWKENHDGLQLGQLIAGDLEFGPRGKDVNSFVASDFIPREHYGGELATSWEMKEDPLRLVFELREEVYWPATEGVMERREFVADDVVATFEHMEAAPRAIPNYWDFIDRWEAKDDHTAVAYLNNYHANWGYLIAWGFYSAILPREWHDLSAEERADWRNSVGTGPYKIESIGPSRQVYVANEDFWAEETFNGESFELPLNEQVVYHLIKDEISAIAALRTGEVDIMEGIRWQFIEQLEQSAPELEIRSAVSPEGTYIALRTDQPPFDDVRVRRAMNLAVNQEQILASLLNEEGRLLNYPFSSRWDLYTPIEELSPEGQALFEYKPEEAKALLAEAGYADGLEFTLTVCSCSPYHMDVVGLLQAYYQRVGITMNVQPLEYGAFRSQMRADSQTAGYLMNNSEGNPFSVLRKSYVSGQTWNPAFYSNEEFDAKFWAAVAERDDDKRRQMLTEMNEFIIEEAVPQVWLPTLLSYRAWWPWVKNYYGELRVGAMRPGPIYARIWIDEEMKEEMGF